ncbi:hypothetical protein ACKWTF_016222 [Chironomus riparius]
MLGRSVIVILLTSTIVIAGIEDIAFRQQGLQNMKNNSMCKTFNQTADKRIFGGETAILGQFPYQVLIYVVSSVNDTCCSTKCGGSLIDEFWVLTAAHCFPDSFHHVELKFGVISTRWSVYEATVPSHNVKIHKGYSKSLHENDIAMIQIPEANFGLLNYPYVDVIELPGRDDNFVGTNATVSGFGRTEKGKSDVLKYVDLQVMENSECSKSYSNVKILDSHVCGRSTTKTGICFGDSGGPYAVKEHCRNILVGIVSFGTADCESEYPDVFTRVSNYLDWINEVMKSSSKLVAVKKIIFVLTLIVILY